MISPALRPAGKALLPTEFEPALKLDAQTQLALQTLARRFLGRRNNDLLCRRAMDILKAKFPDRAITVSDATLPHHRDVKIIHLMVLVDGVPDQGLEFGFRKADGSIFGVAAND